MPAEILLTRCEHENSLLACQIRRSFLLRGQQCSIYSSPLIKYRRLDFDDQLLAKYSGFVITSKFAARILSEKVDASILHKEAKIFVVGQSSAAILKQAGANVVHVAADSAEMASYLQDIEGNILYLSGAKITTPMPAHIKRVIIYSAQYLTKFSNPQDTQFDFVLIYSAACAQQFLNNYSKFNLQKEFSKANFITISEKVSAILKPFFGKVFHPQNPSPADGMIDLMIQIYCQ